MQQQTKVGFDMTKSGRDDEAGLPVTNRKAHRNGPAHGQGALDIIAAQAKEAVIISMGRGQQFSVTVLGEPVAQVQHPNGGPSVSFQ